MAGAAPILRLAVLDGIAPERELDTVATLLAAADADPGIVPTLAVSRLTGRALALGRFQRADHVRPPDTPDDLPRLRRHTGGAACRYGSGQVSVSLVVPDLPAYAGLPFLDKVINRCVRGCVKGLSGLGLHTVYGGRDHLVADGRRVALVSMAVAPGGACLFQAVLGLEAPTGLDGLETGPAGAPPWAALAELSPGLTFPRLALALAGGYASASGRAVRDFDPPGAPGSGAPSDPIERPALCWGEAVPVPIGTVSAGLALSAEGRLESLVLGGELIVDASAAAALTRALAGAPLDAASVQRAVEAVFSDPVHHAVLGVPDLGAITRAVLSAAAHWRNATHAVRV